LVTARFDNTRRKLSIISSHFPSGSSGEDWQVAKYRSLEIISRAMGEAGSRAVQRRLCGTK